MARVCEVCGKRTQTGGSVARRGLPKKKGGVGLRTTGRSHRKFKPNIQRIRAVVDGEPRRLKICTRCMKSGKFVKPLRHMRSTTSATASA
jgi:large subunit ribosomal protein L28